MQYIYRVKTLSMLTGILLLNGFISNYAYADSLSDSGNAANGSKVWADNCARCHNYRAPTEFSAKSWHIVMQHMRIQAGLTGQEARDTYAYLASQTIPAQVSTISTLQTVSAPTESTVVATADTSSKHSTGKPAATVKKLTQLADSTSDTKAKTTAPSTSTQSGNTVYHQTCVSCHGANGKGAIPGVPDFTSKSGPLSKSDSVLLQHIINGFQTPGSSMAMPAKGGNSSLTKQDLQDALAYIRQNFGK